MNRYPVESNNDLQLFSAEFIAAIATLVSSGSSAAQTVDGVRICSKWLYLNAEIYPTLERYRSAVLVATEYHFILRSRMDHHMSRLTNVETLIQKQSPLWIP